MRMPAAGRSRVGDMPNTPELREEVAGVVAVVDVTGEGEAARYAVWHVAIACDDGGPRLRGAWIGAPGDGLDALVRTRPVWALSPEAEKAVGSQAQFLVDAEATDAAVAAAVDALDQAFAEEKTRTGNNWVKPDWSVSVKLAADEDSQTDAGTCEATDTIGDELRSSVLRQARVLEELAIAWAQTQSLRTSRQGKAGSRDFLLADEFGGPQQAPLPFAKR